MKWSIASVLLLVALPASAHVGSPDVFYESDAGAYHALVTIAPPDVIPGLATIGVRFTSEVSQLHLVALPLTADHSAFPPVPDSAERSSVDPHFFTGHLWLMSTGSWQVKLLIDGVAGPAELAIPVPALATRVQGMNSGLGVALLALLLLLVFGMIGIVAAAAREAELAPGETAQPADRKRARVATIVTAAALALAVFGGHRWWRASERAYAQSVYKPLTLLAHVDGGQLSLDLSEPGWLPIRTTADFVPDHGHLMHLFVVRLPAMDRLWHLHPEEVAPAHFTHDLPAMEAGRYALFADVVHADGLAETLTTELTIPAHEGTPLSGDDSRGEAPALGSATRIEVDLPDGAVITWQKPAVLHAGEPIDFRFVVSNAGQPSADLQPYMGMLAHAAILRSDGSVFVHLHPSGSVPMAALMVAQGEHAGHHMSAEGASQISFPYGFPREGLYRIFVQIRRGGQVQTATYDAQVESALRTN